MSRKVIEFDNVGKQYVLGSIGTGTLSQDLNRWWARVRGKEDPFLKVGEVNDRSKKADSRFVWALKDITFDVEQGDVVGIIGKNGAGKSTLLKILSRVTSPTTGSIKVKGRIASLLEVGTGFHPEMTGRENIYMNGSIMGMTKQEITAKLDEIVDFAGVEKYIDTPVKRYSSGMIVRLGFAIAAHLEPEILVVDEVLAVGDAEFQKKAIGKMQDVSKGEGRTVLFVSHNMAAVKSLCTRGVVLNNGQICFNGTTDNALNYYLIDNNVILKNKIIDNIEWINPDITISHIEINDTEYSNSTIYSQQEYLIANIKGVSKNKFLCNVSLSFRNKDEVALAGYDPANSKAQLIKISKGNFEIKKRIKLPHLTKGKLIVDLFIHQPRTMFLLKASRCCTIEAEGYQEKFGYALDQANNGFMGLEDY